MHRPSASFATQIRTLVQRIRKPSAKPVSPRRFRRMRILVVGCGDVAVRLVPTLPAHAVAVTGLCRNSEQVPNLRELSIRPIKGDLDRPGTLGRLRALGQYLVHLAPPAAIDSTQTIDYRSRHLLRALRSWQGQPIKRMVYASTSGVYGDCSGEWVSETRKVQPTTARAKRRVDAENLWRFHSGLNASILRIPGIYGQGRSGGALDRIRSGTPSLISQEDVYTNRIQVDDLARAIRKALFRGAPRRVYHIAEPCGEKLGDYLERLAKLYGLPVPERVTRAEMARRVSATQMTFLSESRRLSTHRMERELKLTLRSAHLIWIKSE